MIDVKLLWRTSFKICFFFQQIDASWNKPVIWTGQTHGQSGYHTYRCDSPEIGGGTIWIWQTYGPPMCFWHVLQKGQSDMVSGWDSDVYLFGLIFLPYDKSSHLPLKKNINNSLIWYSDSNPGNHWLWNCNVTALNVSIQNYNDMRLSIFIK